MTIVLILLGTMSDSFQPPSVLFLISNQKKQEDKRIQLPYKMTMTVIQQLLLRDERLPCLVIIKDTDLCYFSLMFVKKFQILLCRIIGCYYNTLRYELLF